MIHRSAFTFFEMLLVMVFIGVLAAIAIPRFNLAVIKRQEAETTARTLATNLKKIRQLAISNAAVNTDGYKLKLNEKTGASWYKLKDMSDGSLIEKIYIESHVSVTADNKEFKFGPLGSLIDDSGNSIVVSSNSKIYTISIVPATGMVTCTLN